MKSNDISRKDRTAGRLSRDILDRQGDGHGKDLPAFDSLEVTGPPFTHLSETAPSVPGTAISTLVRSEKFASFHVRFISVQLGASGIQPALQRASCSLDGPNLAQAPAPYPQIYLVLRFSSAHAWCLQTCGHCTSVPKLFAEHELPMKKDLHWQGCM